MAKCWFCGRKVSGKLQMIWCTEQKDCCELCLTADATVLWKNLDAKMKRECPLPDGYKIPGRKHG